MQYWCMKCFKHIHISFWQCDKVWVSVEKRAFFIDERNLRQPKGSVQIVPLAHMLQVNILSQYHSDHEVLCSANVLASWSSQGRPKLSTAHIFTSNKLAVEWRFQNMFRLTNLLNQTAHTGRPHPNMSITFIGRSSPLDDLCRQTPRSAQARSRG